MIARAMRQLAAATTGAVACVAVAAAFGCAPMASTCEQNEDCPGASSRCSAGSCIEDARPADPLKPAVDDAPGSVPVDPGAGDGGVVSPEGYDGFLFFRRLDVNAP